jgi:D-alanyl-lipoteichoic acid acyltransferase DltB (MBOAT superfamily)
MRVEYIPLLLLSTSLTFFLALAIKKAAGFQRKALFGVGVAYHLCMLFAFKYFNFFSEATRQALAAFSVHMPSTAIALLAPVGISFYTFQAMSYLFDVQSKKIAPERRFGIFAVYLAFFPKIVAGPIERGGDLLPQFRKKKRFVADRVRSGLSLMLFGYLKKVLIADQLRIVVDAIYASPTQFTGAPLLIASVFFMLQVYFDFSGYTDIALGAAHVLGFRLTQNFVRPYYATSIAEFWRRWHITLSRWFQDYIFNPLYLRLSRMRAFANASGASRHYLSFAVAIVIGDMLLGLWHGANWTFVVFGVYHGVLVAMYYLLRGWWDAIPKVLRVLATAWLVLVGFVIFRANTLGDAAYILVHMFRVRIGEIGLIGTDIAFHRTEAAIVLLAIVFVELWQNVYDKDALENASKRRLLLAFQRHAALRWSIYIIAALLILFFGPLHKARFIYAQF